jgi:hypothetical protein
MVIASKDQVAKSGMCMSVLTSATQVHVPPKDASYLIDTRLA